MKDELPLKVRQNECGILNLQNSDQEGSHWTAWFKKGKIKYYFDSYGDSNPPKELVKYLEQDNLYYNNNRIQDFGDPPVCGHLCLIILDRLSNNEKYEDILNNINITSALELA